MAVIEQGGGRLMRQVQPNSGGRPRRELPPPFDPKPSARFAMRALKESGADGAVIGRIAVWSWVTDESEHAATKDLDIAVSRSELPLLRTWFAQRGLRVTELSIGGINFRDPRSGVNIDFIERSRRGDFSSLFADAVRDALEAKRVVVVDRGTGLPLASAEHLAAMKLATAEPDDERDVERILMLGGANVRVVRGLVKKFLGAVASNRLEVLLRGIGHPAARPRRVSS